MTNKKIFERPFKHTIIYLLSHHLLVVLFFIAFRIVFIIANFGSIQKAFGGELFESFLLGIAQDSAFSGYFLWTLWGFLGIGYLFRIKKAKFYHFAFWFTNVLYIPIFLLMSASIAYYSVFGEHLVDASWVSWFQESFKLSLGVILGYWYLALPSLLLFAGLLWLFFKLDKKLLNRFIEGSKKELKTSIYIYIPKVLLFIILTSFVVDTLMKGEIEKVYKYPNGQVVHGSGIGLFDEDVYKDVSGMTHEHRIWYIRPLRTKSVKHPINTALQQNPAFCFFDTVTNNGKIGDDLGSWNFDALPKNKEKISEILSNQMGIEPPIKRHQYCFEGKSSLKHVVLILMEGFSKLDYYEEIDTTLTPFMRNLSKKSLYFPNAYSTGEATKFGIAATLLGIPTLKGKHPLEAIYKDKFDNLPGKLRSKEFYNTWLITHDPSFDNIGLFSRHTFDKMLYPISEVDAHNMGAFGIPDDIILEKSVEQLSKTIKENEKTFTFIMTCSNHGPFYIPDYFESKFEDKHLRAVNFADASLKRFFEKAKQQSWFDETLFVLFGDHGDRSFQIETPLRKIRHEIPIFFYAPKHILPKKVETFALQEDIFPTVMNFLKEDYTSSHLGIDLIKNKRSIAYYTSLQKYFTLNDSIAYAEGEPGQIYLYKEGFEDQYRKNKHLAENLKLYTQAIYYSAQNR